MLEDVFGLAGKIGLVTGAGRGLGQAAALGLAEAGADVAIVSRTPDQLASVARSIEALGRRALVIPADLFDWRAAGLIVETVVDAWGRVDILVNNAGIAIPEPCNALTQDAIDAQIAVNVKAPIELCQAALPYFIRQGHGRIISITSLATALAAPQLAGYGLTKAALLMYTRTVAVEMARAGHDIRANCIAPGWFETEMTSGLGVGDDSRTEALDPANRERAQKLMDRIPLGRRAKPPEIRGAVIFLSGPAASYVTGSELVIDGGWLSASP